MQQSPFVMMGQPGDLSFERLSPQLPPVFEYNSFKYIDTARVEPRIAYSPEKTPPKTPETPHFGRNPFPKPYEDSGLVNPVRILIFFLIKSNIEWTLVYVISVNVMLMFDFRDQIGQVPFQSV
jgi:hypothetical protein